MQVRIQANCNADASDLALSDDEFTLYCQGVDASCRLVIEKQDDLESSYVIIDPFGFLVSNANERQTTVGSVLDNPLYDLLSGARVDNNKFMQRY